MSPQAKRLVKALHAHCVEYYDPPKKFIVHPDYMDVLDMEDSNHICRSVNLTTFQGVLIELDPGSIEPAMITYRNKKVWI